MGTSHIFQNFNATNHNTANSLQVYKFKWDLDCITVQLAFAKCFLPKKGTLKLLVYMDGSAILPTRIDKGKLISQQ